MRNWIVAVLILMVIRLAITPWSPGRIQPDTNGYLSIANRSTIAELFASTDRPPAYPLMLRFLGIERTPTPAEKKALGSLGIILSVAATLLLAGASRVLFRYRFQMGLALLFWLVWSLSEVILPWENLLLSETYGVSGFILIAGLLLVHSVNRRVRTWCEWAIALLTLALMFLRLSHVVFGPITIAAILTSRYASRRSVSHGWKALSFPKCLPLLLIAVGCCFAFGLARRPSIVRSGCYVDFFYGRVLNDPPVRAVYEHDYGIPDFIVARANEGYWTGVQGGNHVWSRDPKYMDWIQQFIEKRHMPFLLRHPALSLHIFYRGCGILFDYTGYGYNYMWIYDTGWEKQPAPRLLPLYKALNRIVCLPLALLHKFSDHLLIAFPGFVLFLMPLVFTRPLLRRSAALFVFLSLTFYSQYAVSIFFEMADDTRHACIGTAALLAILWLFGILAAGELWMKHRRASLMKGQAKSVSPSASPGAD